MSTCPIGVNGRRCPNDLDKPWHLCCAKHWAQVPPPVQARVYRLFKTARGSTEHHELCLEIIGDLST